MICAKTQRWLLTSDHNEQPGREIRGHLASCSLCLAMQKRLRLMESQVSEIPVPSSKARGRFVERVRAGGSVFKTNQSPADRWLRGHSLPTRERGLRKVAVAVALAASLAVIAFGLWNLPKVELQKPGTQDGLAIRRKDRDEKLASTKSPREKVEVLREIARNLEAEAFQLASQTRNDDLRVVARFYNEVIGGDLLKSAQLLNPEDRGEVIRPIMVMLANLQSQIERTRGTVPKTTFDCLDEMVVAAKDTQDRLDKLMAG